MRICVCCRKPGDAPPYSTSVPSWQASEASYLLSYRKEVPPSPFRCHAPLPKPLTPPFPPQPRAPETLAIDSKVPNLTFVQPLNQLNNPRKSHSSTVLLHTGSDTCGSSSSSFLPWIWMEGAGAARGARGALSLSQ